MLMTGVSEQEEGEKGTERILEVMAKQKNKNLPHDEKNYIFKKSNELSAR